MRTVSGKLLLLILFSAVAYAQVPSGNVFVGYSYLNVDTNNSVARRANLNGWEGSVEGKVLPFLGVVGDFSGNYGRQSVAVECPVTVAVGGNCPSTFDARTYSGLFGPRVSVSVKGVRPFAHVLIGFSESNLSASGSSKSSTSFAAAVGGGADFRIIRFAAWRVQADIIHTAWFHNTQINARVSTGLVLRF